jgi:hypothetical protein
VKIITIIMFSIASKYAGRQHQGRFLPALSKTIISRSFGVGGSLVAHQPVKYWNCTWDEKHLGILHDFELRGMEKRRLLRLHPDYNDSDDWYPKTRTEFMTVAAREALVDDDCTVVGGFIRDWIIRGEEPKDVDLRIYPHFNSAAFIDRCKKWDLHTEDGEFFSTPSGDKFLVDTSIGNMPIDLDVNNFAISKQKGLHKREYKDRPICKTYGNIKRKVAYLINNNPGDRRCDYIKGRVTKMQSRGWEVIRSESLDKNCD